MGRAIRAVVARTVPDCAGDRRRPLEGEPAGGAALVAATAMGGGLASLPDVPESFFPGDGGVAGLVKTLAREWEGVRSRVVDVDPADDPDDLAALFVAELLADDHCKEAGYHEGRRIALRPVEVELPVSSSEGVTILPGDPILITGGAGITATIARDLAERWRPTLLLVGTTALPEVDDSGTGRARRSGRRQGAPARAPEPPRKNDTRRVGTRLSGLEERPRSAHESGCVAGTGRDRRVRDGGRPERSRDARNSRSVAGASDRSSA